MIRAFLPSLVFVASAVGTSAGWFLLQERLPSVGEPRSFVPPELPEIEALPEVPLQYQRLSVDQGQRASLLERPLFSETRRPIVYLETAPDDTISKNVEEEAQPVFLPPPEPVIEEDIESAPEPPRVRMTGFISEENAPKALIADEINGEEVWYAVGAEVNGWRIVSIKPYEVAFVRAGHDFVVRALP